MTQTNFIPLPKPTEDKPKAAPPSSCAHALWVDYLKTGRICNFDKCTCFIHGNPDLVKICFIKKYYEEFFERMDGHVNE